MPDSSSLFTAYRQRRLQSFTARFSQAPAEAWDGHDSLATLFNEQLTLGNRFHLPIQPSARFTPETAALAAETLAVTSRDAVLVALTGDFEDPDYLTIWELFENTAQSLALLTPVSALGSEAAGLGNRLAAEMQRMPGSDPSTPIDDLAHGISRALADWSSAASACSVGEARLLLVGLLHRHILSAFSAPANFWEILLLKLELSIASPGASPALAQLMSPVFRVAWSALPLQPALHAFWKIHGGGSTAEIVAAERITTLASLARAGGPSATLMRAAITPEWVASAPASTLCDPSAGWRASITQGLEMSAYQPLLQAADHWRGLLAAGTSIPAAVQSHSASLRKIADDLAQGMPGKDTAELFVALSSELVARGLWIATLTANPAEARELFLQPAVRELGLDAAAGLWKKLSRLSSALQQLATAQTGSLPWNQISPLLRALEARAAENKLITLRWSPPVAADTFNGLPFASADGPQRCARDVGHLLTRLSIEQRIHGGQRGGVELARWYATQVLPRLAHLPDEAFRERWDVIAETGFSAQPEHAALNTAARRFGHNLPRLTAAWKLELNAEEIATAVANEVMATLPDYGARVGPTGLVSCVRDNTLTLRQVASLLLADTASPHEVLAEWWNSAVGSYLATRPARLFETNLAAIYHALNHHLDTAEVAAAFTPIQIVYRESLGIECLEALTGAPTLLVGPLARRYTAATPLPAPERQAISVVLRGTLADQGLTEPKIHDALLNSFLVFHRERWNTGDIDTATARVLPQLGQPPLSQHRPTCAAALLYALADPAAATASQALLLAESADGFMLAIGQSGVAENLVYHAAEIAAAYSEAMVACAPAHFSHLERADATARCQRDQTLLLRNLGERLARTAPGLFWVDATRWFLELLSPFVDYPSHIWALSARTVAKHLGPKLGGAENLFLSRWVTHFEHLAAGWASSHALAKKVFNPTDYSFSARAEEDRLQRDLLAAAFAAHFAPATGTWSGSAIYHRFLLSWPAATRTQGEIQALLKNLIQVAGALIPAGVARWLALTPSALAALSASEGGHPTQRYAKATGLPAATEAAKTLELALGDEAAIALWRHVRTHPAAEPLPALAQAAVRAHLLHPFDSKQPRALASSFPAAARTRTGLVTTCLAIETAASSWGQLAEELIPHAASANTVRSHFTTLALEWPAVQAGVSLSATADEHAAGLLGKLEGGADTPYSSGTTAECDRSTNSLSFAYAFRQTATAAWDQASEPPRLFFGFAADNHRQLDTVVAANAHVRVNSALRASLPAGSALVTEAMLGLEAPLFPATGPLWRELALHDHAETPDYVGALFGAIRPLADSAAAYATGNDVAKSAPLADRLCHHLEALTCGLEESGDFEAAWELLLLRLAPDLESQPPALLISAFYGLTQDLSKKLPAGPALFWRTLLLATIEVIRQACLGRHLLQNAAALARDYAVQAVKADGPVRQKCARDQEHVLATVGQLLATQAPVRAWLNLTSHFTEITLPHLSHGAVELSAAWCRHESALTAKIDPSLRPAAWVWFGALQRMARNLPAVRPFAATAVPALAGTLAAKTGESPADWRRFLSALAAAAASPDEGPAPGNAMVEKLLLATPLGGTHAPAAWIALAELIGAECEILLPGRVPNSLKRRLIALPAIAQRLHTLANGKGSRLVRACAAQAAHPLARSLWQASLLARARPGERLVESDRADALAAQALNLSLEADEAVLARFAAVQSSLGIGAQLPLVATKSAGLLSRFGLGKKSFDWLNDAGLRVEAVFVIEVLTLQAVTGHVDSAHIWYWGCPPTVNAVHPEKEGGTIEFYQALAISAAQKLGSQHPGAAALGRFVQDIASRFAGMKLTLSGDVTPDPIALRLLGLREAGDTAAYAHLAPLASDAPALVVQRARSQGRPLSEDQVALVQRAHAELLRSVS